MQHPADPRADERVASLRRGKLTVGLRCEHTTVACSLGSWGLPGATLAAGSVCVFRSVHQGLRRMGRNVLVLRCQNGATLDTAVPLSLMCGQDGPATVTTRSFHEPRKPPPSSLSPRRRRTGTRSRAAVLCA